MIEKVKLLNKKKSEALLAGGVKRLEDQHKKGKLSARERIHVLLDEGSFQEIGMFVTHRCTDFGMEDQVILGDGVITGFGTVHGSVLYVYIFVVCLVGNGF